MPLPPATSAFVETSYLTNGAAGGVALSGGARLPLGTHAALSADLGYGVLSGPATTQDRWWILPAIAWVIPHGAVSLELGAGLGLGGSSGYDSFAAYMRGPFSPAWSFQLVPAARAHVMMLSPLGRDVDVFVRVEAVTLPLLDSHVGFQTSRAALGPADSVWVAAGAGLALHLP